MPSNSSVRQPGSPTPNKTLIEASEILTFAMDVSEMEDISSQCQDLRHSGLCRPQRSRPQMSGLSVLPPDTKDSRPQGFQCRGFQASRPPTSGHQRWMLPRAKVLMSRARTCDFLSRPTRLRLPPCIRYDSGGQGPPTSRPPKF